MYKRFILLQLGFLLVFYQQTLETNAEKCIVLNEHVEEISRCCRYEPFCSHEAEEMCIRELNPPRTEMVTDSLNFTVCFLDCAYRHMGYLKANNEIDVQAYVAFLSGFDKDYQLMISNAIAKCVEIRNEMQPNEDNMGLKCNMFAVLFQECITIFTFRNCPAERWTNSKICNELKMGVPLCTYSKIDPLSTETVM